MNRPARPIFYTILWTGLVVCLQQSAFSDTKVEPLVCGLSSLAQIRNGSATNAKPGAISADGRHLLFLSSEDLTGENPDGNLELFLIDLADYRINQITRTAGFTPIPGGFSADDNLTRVVFRSPRHPLSGESTARQGIYLLDVGTGDVLTLLSGTSESPDPSPPVLSGNGLRIAILSADNPAGTNLDSSREVFVFDVESSALLQISQLPSTSVPQQVSLSSDGRFVAVLVSHLSFSEIRIFDMETEDFSAALNAPPFSLGNLFLSPDGKRLLFSSTADLVGENPDGSQEIFQISMISPLGPISLQQITAFLASTSPAFQSVSYSRTGRWLAFLSSSDLLGWPGKDASNLFLLDVETQKLTQATYFSQAALASVGPPVLSDDGRTILLSTVKNSGQGKDRELILAQCAQSQFQFFPHVGSGALGNRQIQTQFVFSNSGPSTPVEISFFDSSGTPLALALEGLGTHSELNFQMASGTPFIVQTTGAGQLSVGYARVTAGPNVSGTAIFTGKLHPSGLILHEAAVPLTTSLNDFSIVMTTKGRFSTGLAMVNTQSLEYAPTEGPEPVKLRLYNEEGTLLALREIALPPGSHTAFFVSDIFSGVAGVGEMTGLLTAESQAPIAAISLRQYDHPQLRFPSIVPTLTTLPVAPGRPHP